MRLNANSTSARPMRWMLFLACCVAALLATGCNPQIIRTPADARTVITTAQETLAGLPTAQEIGEIDNPDARSAAIYTRQSIDQLTAVSPYAVDNAGIALANVTLWISELERVSGPHTCTFKCRADQQQCLVHCEKSGRRFCGCRLLGAGCIITAWRKHC